MPTPRRLQALVFFSWLGAGGMAQAGQSPTLLVFGDSLSTPHGIEASESWPALLQQRLENGGHAVRVVNASRKGETSDGGRKRLQATLDRHRPNWVVLELGANDGLSKASPERLRKNLNRMVAMIRASGATPILVGMELPPSYELDYAARFSTAYYQAARDTEAPFIPFFLEKIARHPDMFLADRLHPNARAQPKLLEAVWPVIAPLLSRP